VSGSYAYVAAFLSDALVVVDVSNPASPVIRGSVVSSSLLNTVRAIQFCDRSLWRGWRRAPRLRRHLPSYSHPQRHRLLDALSRVHVLALTCCACRLSASP
jgi:hypothetical protein